MTDSINKLLRTLGVAAGLVGCLNCSFALGDSVQLRDGNVITGKYVGGTAGTIRIQAPQGMIDLEIARVYGITFSTTAPIAAPAPQPTQMVAVSGPVMVPAGTVLTIRMETAVSSNDAPGKKFTARLLADLMAGNVTVAKAGAIVYGQVDKTKQAGRLAGKSELEFSLTGIDISGRIQPILTTNFAEAGKGEFRSTARNVAGGALIGNAIDNDGGAGVGAAVGVGASLIKKGEAITVPQGALLEFRLTQPFQATAG